jgi:hypothetical protein
MVWAKVLAEVLVGVIRPPLFWRSAERTLAAGKVTLPVSNVNRAKSAHRAAPGHHGFTRALSP